MHTYILTGVLAMSVVGLHAQRPDADPQAPTQGRPAPQADTRATPPQGQVTTLTGCLYNERDIPGRTPNVAERAGVLEDYILAEVTMSGQTGGRPGHKRHGGEHV
jgi:hypothetical protein